MQGHLKGGKETAFKYKMINWGKQNFERETTVMWNQMVDCIRRVTKEVLGELQEKKYNYKETYWWILDVLQAV